MPQNSSQQLEALYSAVQALARVYTFRDPSNACLFDLRVNECYVLDLLVEEGAMSTSALADRLGIHKSNASRIAIALQQDGLLDSLPDPVDRRAVILAPTDKGRAMHTKIKDYLVGRFEGVLTDLNAEEVKRGTELIERLALDAQRRIIAEQ